jgi:DNA-binding MarR family transcriptional regulator
MATALQGTESAAGAIARVRYTHDGMLDLILGNPTISQGQIASHFGYTQAWVSRIMNSDAFQARLAERKGELIDPTIVASIEEKLRALASKSLDVVLEKLTATGNPDTALKALEVTTKALGYGARQQNLNVQQNFVVALPGKAESAEIWAQAHGPQGVLGGGPVAGFRVPPPATGQEIEVSATRVA